MLPVPSLPALFACVLCGAFVFYWFITTKSPILLPTTSGNRMNETALQTELQALQEKMQRIEEELSWIKAEKNIERLKFQKEEPKKRILITGGAGFVGSHLVDRLMLEGHNVIVLDDFSTGRERNVEQWLGDPNFALVEHDVINPYFAKVDQIFHLASPASPPQYMANPVKTIETNTHGTTNMLRLAKGVNARILLASTSEVYGDPQVHPQPEEYWGHVNTIGPRSCYDEGKRVAESLMVAYSKQDNVEIRIARIFNTFGPRMNVEDGRVVSNFVIQSLQEKPITIYGDGNQTRSFQYVDDLVDGLVKLMNSNTTLPVNIGNPEEHSVRDFARIIRDLVGSNSDIIHLEQQEDDPKQRRPDIRRAAELLQWRPKVAMREGLKRTIAAFRRELQTAREKGAEDYET